MIFLASFIIFLIFIFFLAIGYIFKRKGLVSESEAHQLLSESGISCAHCTSSCTFAGQQRKPTKKCLAEVEIPSKTI